MPTINKPFLFKLLVALVLISGAVFGLHAIQAGRIPEALRGQAERASQNGKLDVAIHYYRQYLEFSPDDVEAQVELAALLRKRNPTARGQADVIFLYDRILRLDPQRHSIRREALESCLRLGRYSDALTHAQALIQAFPNESKLWQLLGAAQVGLNQLTDARSSFKTAIKYAPDEMIPYQRLAQLVWRNQNDIPEARVVLDRMTKALPQEPEAHLVRARFETFHLEESGSSRGDLKRALAELQRVLELDPEHVEACLLLAEIYQREQKIPAAHAILRDAAALYPRDLRVIRSLSWLELVRGNAPAAIAVLEDGLKANSEGFELLVPLADLLVQQGDTTRSSEILRRLESRKAPVVQVKYLRARLAMRDARWSEAISLLETLRTEINNLPGLETQLNLLIAVSASKLGHFEAEEKAFQRVLQSDPKNVQARVGLGNLFLNLGRFDEAVRELEIAAESPYASGQVVSQWVRTKLHRYKTTNATQEDWRKLDLAMMALAKKFSAASSEPIILRAEVGIAGGKAAEAIQLLRGEAARRPGDTRLWLALAEAVTDFNGTTAGLAVIDEAQAATGDGADVRLARARISALEPGRVRPLAPLTAQIEAWPEAEKLRLLFGMVEVFEHIGDQASVVQTLRRIAGLRPTDPAIWARLHERASRTGEVELVREARSTLIKLQGESASLVMLADATAADAQQATAMKDRVIAAFGAEPTRADACLALARLHQLTGHTAEAERLTARAFLLEPTRYEAARALLLQRCNQDDEKQIDSLLTRLTADPRWRGEPFARLITNICGKVQQPIANKLLDWTKRKLESEPGALGWLADTAIQHRLQEPLPLLLQAIQAPHPTTDDWLRLALVQQHHSSDARQTLASAKAKLPPAGYAGLLAIFQEMTGDELPDLKVELGDPRLLVQARLAVKLSRNQTEAAAKLIEGYLKSPDLAAVDQAWAHRNLAMLYAVGGQAPDRKRAMQLLQSATTDDSSTVEELRSTASVLTTLSRYLEGADRLLAQHRAITALDAAFTKGKSPRDLFGLSQLYRVTGNRADSRKCLQVLLNGDPDNIYYLVTALEELIEDQNYSSAAAFARKLLERHPGEFQAVAAVARYECKANRPEVALKIAERYAQAADPSAGDHFARSGRVAELLDELSRTPSVRGTSAGRAMTDAAVERFATLIPTRPEATIGLVGVLAADGRSDAAFAQLERFGQAVPARIRAAAGLAIVRSGNTTERQAATVVGWIDHCLTQEPKSVALLLNRSEYLTHRLDLIGAVAELEKVLALEPRNVVALNNLAWILAADPATAERALALLAQATREVGLSGDLLDTRARARITLKQYEQANRDLTDAIRTAPTALRWFHLAVSRLGQSPTEKDEAAKAFREAKRRGLEVKGIHPADRGTYDVLEARNRSGS